MRTLVFELLAVAVVALIAFGLRYGTDVTALPATFDEPYIRIPVDALLADGWSVATAIDFEETKGPAFIWTYAALGAVFGPELSGLRIVSVLFFVLSAWPLIVIARRAGVAPSALPAVTVLYALLPYHAVLGQLLMSEASFVAGLLATAWVVQWGLGSPRMSTRRIVAPALFGVLVAILLHHRIHVVALAGAACLVAAERDRLRSWPWWLAAALAGLARIPLWIRWDGLVSPRYQGVHDLGFGIDGATYLVAGLVPFLALFLVPALTQPHTRGRRWLIGLGAGVGGAIALLGMPHLAETTTFEGLITHRFGGFTASICRRVSADPGVQSVVLFGLSAAGAASLGALAALAWSRDEREGAAAEAGWLGRLIVWTLAGGAGLYVLTQAGVYDRYLTPWAAPLAVLWWLWLGPRLRWVQVAGLGAIAAWHVNGWLLQ